MAVDQRALAYAKFHYPIFLSRYVGAARAGRSDIIPETIRGSIVAYVQGRPGTVDVESWITSTLYDYRVQNGYDAPVPPEFS